MNAVIVPEPFPVPSVAKSEQHRHLLIYSSKTDVYKSKYVEKYVDFLENGNKMFFFFGFFPPAGQHGAQDLPVWALRLQGQQDGDPGGWRAHPLGTRLLWQSGQREGARRSVSGHIDTL